MNPFGYGTVVRGKQFFDRRDECERIVKTLAGGNNMVLYAPRRYGKTSLIFKAIEALEQQGFVCIYFDFMPVYSLESFVRLYTKALAAKQSNLTRFAQTLASIVRQLRPVVGFGTDGSPEMTLDMAGLQVDEGTVGQLLDMTERLGTDKKRVLVFMDEFQEVEKLKSFNFESLIRSKVQQQTKTNYLFFGSKTHLLKEMFNNRNRAFYNAAMPMTLDKLPEGETIEYLQGNFKDSGITIDDDTARYLIAATANIPHYVQLLAAEVWQYTTGSCEQVTNSMVDLCVQGLLALKSDYYMELYDRQSNSRKQLLQALSQSGNNIFSSEYINKYGLPSASTLQRAAKGLIDDGTVERSKGNYFIADPFFKIFIIKQI